MTPLSLPFIALVGLSGAVGAVARYLLGRFIAERASAQFPLGTLVINLTGAFLIGLLFALAGHKIISASQQVMLATGFLGGYTTFSTMSWEGVQLVRGGSMARSMLYLGGSVTLGLVCTTLGLLLGGWVL
ncbi:MAG: fluoride efflux transporter CrcB [Ktedonobacteraceae bacterium]